MNSLEDWVEVPQKYWIVETGYRCKQCANEFSWHWPEGGEIVKFYNVVTQEERWLPTYGKNGYLELLERVVPDFLRGHEISHKVAEKFRQAFSATQENANDSEGVFSIDERPPTCPACSSRELNELSREVKVSPPVVWLDYRGFLNPPTAID